MVYHSYAKNYELNEIQTAFIGDPLIKVNDSYCFSQPMFKYVVSNNDFTIKASYKRFGMLTGNTEIKVLKKMKYPVYSVIDEDKGIYYVVFIPDINKESTYGILIDSKGNISNTMHYLKENGVSKNIDTKFEPLSPRFTYADKSNCDRYYTGNTNYELLYNGVNNVTLTLTYREFTANDLVKPAFYQNLVYQTDANHIRFKQYKVDVLETDNEKIKYRVVEEESLYDSQFFLGNDDTFEKIIYRRNN